MSSQCTFASSDGSHTLASSGGSCMLASSGGSCMLASPQCTPANIHTFCLYGV